jgi:hypothetical protein
VRSPRGWWPTQADAAGAILLGLLTTAHSKAAIAATSAIGAIRVIREHGDEVAAAPGDPIQVLTAEVFGAAAAPLRGDAAA